MCFEPTIITGLSHLSNTPKELLKELPQATRFPKQIFRQPSAREETKGLVHAGQALCYGAASPAHEACLYLIPLHLYPSHFLSNTALALALCPLTQKQEWWWDLRERDGGGLENTGKWRQKLLFLISRPGSRPNGEVRVSGKYKPISISLSTSLCIVT